MAGRSGVENQPATSFSFSSTSVAFAADNRACQSNSTVIA